MSVARSDECAIEIKLLGVSIQVVNVSQAMLAALGKSRVSSGIVSIRASPTVDRDLAERRTIAVFRQDDEALADHAVGWIRNAVAQVENALPRIASVPGEPGLKREIRRVQDIGGQ